MLESGGHEFWKEHLAPLGSHLVPKRMPRPVITTVSENLAAHTHLPLEVMVMVYDFADLESCVNLRETSSAWYSLFHEMDFKAKMTRRNPWICPQDDLSSWADCVLVFVTRLRRWQCADSVHQLHIPPNPRPQKKLIATKLERDGKKLPTDMTGVMGESGGLAHMIKMERYRLEDSGYDGSYRETWDDDEKTVIEREEPVEVTLPPSIPSENISILTHTLQTESWVAVQLVNDQFYLLPRDKPYFEHGVLLDGHTKDLREIGGTLFQGYSIHSKYKDRIFDCHTKRMVEYPHANGHSNFGLSASYNGLLWWWGHLALQKETRFYPTFIDLASPGKVYYCPERAVTGLSRCPYDQGSRSCGMAQFVVAMREIDGGREEELEIVDLATGTITAVSVPRDWRRHEFKTVVGLVRDPEDGETRFQARVMPGRGSADKRHRELDGYAESDDSSDLYWWER